MVREYQQRPEEIIERIITKEKRAERIPNVDAILEIIGEDAENCKIDIQRRDEDGYLYFLTLKVTGGKNDNAEYIYNRVGYFGNQNESEETVINIVFYDKNGIAYTSDTVARFSEEENKWTRL